LQEKIKINDTFSAIIASFGLLVAFIVNDVYIENARQSYSAVLVLEICVSVSTVILVCLIYRHYHLRHKIHRADAITPRSNNANLANKRDEYFIRAFLANESFNWICD